MREDLRLWRIDISYFSLINFVLWSYFLLEVTNHIDSTKQWQKKEGAGVWPSEHENRQMISCPPHMRSHVWILRRPNILNLVVKKIVRKHISGCTASITIFYHWSSSCFHLLLPKFIQRLGPQHIVHRAPPYRNRPLRTPPPPFGAHINRHQSRKLVGSWDHSIQTQVEREGERERGRESFVDFCTWIL